MVDVPLWIASRFAKAITGGNDIRFDINTEKATAIQGSSYIGLRETIDQIEDVMDCLWSYKTALVLAKSNQNIPVEFPDTTTEATQPASCHQSNAEDSVVKFNTTKGVEAANTLVTISPRN